MEPKGLIAKAGINIHANKEKVWEALVNPELIREYMFGTQVISEWKKGSAIVWKGEWQGKHYEDKGTILEFDPPDHLQYTHYSPLTDLEDKTENYNTVTIKLSSNGEGTRVDLWQDNNTSEKAVEHSTSNWEMILSQLKELVEEIHY